MFRIVLISKPSGASLREEVPSKSGDIDMVLDGLCRNAQESGELEFVIEGFGRRWPVDVFTDFRIFLGQLPDLRDSLDRQIPGNFQLRFYEQGIENDLLIERTNEDLLIECVCWGRWLPNPNVETLTVRDFEQMINDVTGTFLRYVEGRYPQLYGSSLFQNWGETVR